MRFDSQQIQARGLQDEARSALTVFFQPDMKLTGTITWLMDGEFEQRKTSGILRDNGEFALNFDNGEPGTPFLYSVVLHPIRDDFLKGEYIGGRGTIDETSGPVTCHVYKGARGYVLAGRWTENGHIDQWFAELSSARKSKH